MSVTVHDCLKLPCLMRAKLVAGHKGLDSIVDKISVIEFDDYRDDFFTSNEIVITSFYSVKDDVNEQCRILEHSKKSGDVAMILFYSDIIMHGIDSKLLDTANNISFPLIVLPEDNISLSYSDVISDVMEAVFLDKQAHSLVDNNIALAKKIYPYENTFNISQLSLAEKCRNLLLSQNSRKLQAHLSLIDPIKDYPDLVSTLSVYLIDADSQLNITAKLTFLHRNTVIYRLNKAKNLLGNDFNRMPFKYDIYFALALVRVLSS
ncbi:MAG: PucR family transcriptional regulator [Hornefia sp.]|nr:PucR family transcriptional regulator [Hornefia sp.]